VNPASAGGRTAGRWQGIVSQLREHEVACEVAVTKQPGDATQLTREWLGAGGIELVILGGDGTVNEVAAGCLHEDGTSAAAAGITWSVIHQGTGGDFARGLGIPRDTAGAIAVAAGTATRAVDLGVATFVGADGAEHVRGWVSCCNVGMGADVVARVTGRYKRLGDSAGFAAGTVATFARHRPRRVRISLDGVVPHPARITEITAANNRYMGGGMLVAPDALLDDGLLDVVTIAAGSRLRLLGAFPKIYRGTHVDHPLVSIERARRLYVAHEADEQPQGVVLDGELVGHTPAQFRLLERALLVRVPRT